MDKRPNLAWLQALAWAILLGLQGCGGCGGSSGGGDPPQATNQPPTAVFSATPQSGTAPLVVTFDAGGCVDPDGTIASYAWDFGDGATDSGVTTNHTFTAAGNFPVTLTVTDNAGAAASVQHGVTVAGSGNQPPTASFTTTPQSGVVHLQVSFDASASVDTDGTIASYAWSFGDGGTAAGMTATHTFATAGTFPVTLTITDDDGDTDEAGFTLVVSQPANQGPTAAFTATPSSGSAPLEVIFDASASSDPDGTISSYAWDFGDGNSGFGSSANHTFATAGSYPVTLTVTDDDGAIDSAQQSVTVSGGVADTTPPSVTVTSPATGAAITGPTPFAATASDDTAVTRVEFRVDGALIGQDSAAPYETSFHSAGFTDGAHALIVTAYDAAGNSDTDSVTVAFENSVLVIPPAPEDVASDLPETQTTPLADATAFLYSGSDPVQTGVVPGTIEAERAAVLRGRVADNAGVAIDGVRITVLSHPEFGQTLTRADGVFDLAVNGGGQITLVYREAGYLTAQRQMEVPWQDYRWAPDVVLKELDTAVTEVTPNAPTMQVARATPTTDADGTRRSTLVIPANTGAEIVLADGTRQAATTLNIRSTEYTVGDHGPEAMPAPLPPYSGYTYAVELTADEVPAGAELEFSQPLYHYVENFIGFPVGSAVPTGYYDRKQGHWVASENGRVIEILEIRSGAAILDTDGDGVEDDAATLAALEITADEQQSLAGLYPTGLPKSLWRTPIPHFTPWDHNWPYGPPDDARLPRSQPRKPKPRNPCEGSGSIIECQTQRLGESIPVVGTPYSMVYFNDRVPDHVESMSLDIVLSGDSIPASLTNILLEIEIAGRSFQHSFPAQTDLTHRFVWDGFDAYGRQLPGLVSMTYRIGYVHPSVYFPVPAEFGSAFNRLDFRTPGSGITLASDRSEVVLWLTQEARLGRVPDGASLSPGWSLDGHHFYDVVAETLHLGDGRTRTSSAFGNSLALLIGGGGHFSTGIPSISYRIGNHGHLAMSPSGELHVSNPTRHVVVKIDSTGTILPVAGTDGLYGAYSGDGGPATAAELSSPSDIVFGPDGSLYIADPGNQRVRKVDPAGTISTVVGGGSDWLDFRELVPATNGAGVTGLDVGPDGTLFLALSGYHCVRRVDTDGLISTVAGLCNGQRPDPGDDGLAVDANLLSPSDVVVTNDGTLYIAESGAHVVRKVAPDGIISTAVGLRDVPGSDGDGGPGALAYLNGPTSLALAEDGSLFIAEYRGHRVRVLSPDGTINTLAGDGTGDDPPADQQSARQAPLPEPHSVAIGGDGTVFLASRVSGGFYPVQGYVLNVVPTPISTATLDTFVVPASESDTLYVFDGLGRHQRSLSGLSGAVEEEISYDAHGRLAAISDADGNTTTIERDASGVATAIVAQNGQRTLLTADANGFIDAITNPAGETTTMTYTAGGLLASLTDPGGGVHTFTYDALGRLLEDEDPAGGIQSLLRTESGNGYQVDLSTPLGFTTSYGVQALDSGEERLTVLLPDGSEDERVSHTDGSATLTMADGTQVFARGGPDPRWGMNVPLAERVVVSTPGGLSNTTTRSRSAGFDPADPTRVATLTDTETINGLTTTRVYDGATGSVTTTSPAGRESTTTIDTQGRVTDILVSGLNPVHNTYDTAGRLVEVVVGEGADARVTTVDYGADGNLDQITDPLGRLWSFDYDLDGRLVAEHLPGGRTIGYGYDVDGNVTSLTPPGRPAHTSSYSATGLPGEYVPPHPDPADPTSDPRSTYTHDLDGQLTRLTRPDGRLVDLGYDSAGRLAQVDIAEGTYTIAYDTASGRLSRVTATDNSTLSFTYDGALPTGEAWADGPVTGNVGYTYDNDFRVASVQVNGATLAAHSYDDDGLLTQAGTLSLTRDAQHGLFTGSSLGAVTDSVTYDGFGEIASYQATYQGATFFTVQYMRDATGRITSRTESHSGQTTTFGYAYDAAGRLASVSENGTTTAEYQYDANGNRTSRVAGGQPAETGVYDDQDRLTQYSGETFTYTAHGELLTRTEGALTTRYAYDALGDLRAVTLSDGTLIDYLIDGNGRRIGRKVDGVLVQGLLYADEINPIAELDGTGAVAARFVYGSRPNTPDYMEKGGSTYRIVSDHLGSPRFVVDVATGTVAQQLEYDEFGVVVTDTNPGFQPFGFCGGLYDPATRLTRFGVRHYDAAVGRWTAKDPIGFAGDDTNLYAYVENDPVNWIDPHGLGRWYSYFDWLDPVGNAVAGFGDVVSFGLTKRIRQSANIDAMVDPCSSSYFGGKVAGVVHGLLSRGIALSNWARAAKLSKTLAARETVRSRHAVYKAWEAARQAARSKAIRDGLANAAKAARGQGLPSPASITSLGSSVSGSLPSPASLVTPSLNGLRVTFGP